MNTQKYAYITLVCSLLSACGGGGGVTSSAPLSSSVPASPLPSPSPSPSNTANNIWPVTAYKTLKANDESSFSKVASISSTTINKGTISFDGNNLELTGTVAADQLQINGWTGSWAHKVDFRALMLCDANNKSRYVLIEDKSPVATINDLKGKTFEYVEDCIRDSNPVNVAQDGSVNGLSNLSAVAISQAFSANGYNNGSSTLFLHAYKVQYPDGRYWYFVIEIGKNNSDSSKGYIGWWKQTAPVN